MAQQKEKQLQLVYEVDDEVRSTRDWLIYGLQWVITMVYAVVWGYAIVGLAMGFKGEELSNYMAAVVLTIGLSTLVQAWLGHRMAMVSGPNIVSSLAIVAAITAGGKEYAQHAFLAQAISSIVIVGFVLLGGLKLIKKIWSPLLLGAMVLLVGLSIAKQGLTLLTAAGFDWQFFTCTALALIALSIALRTKGILATIPPLLVIVPGYLIFMFTGKFDWQLVAQAEVFVLPKLLPYGLEMPPLDLILIMVVVNLMAMLNVFGNLIGYAKLVNHKLEDKPVKRSFLFFGAIETCFAGVLGVPATVAYGENLGIVTLTRVAARKFIIAAAIIFSAFAFIGPLGGLMAAMPQPVAGAVLLGIASSVIGIGAGMMTAVPSFGTREQSIVGFSVFLSLGLFLLPEETWKEAPRLMTTIFSNPIIAVILFVLFFEQVLFRQKSKNTT